MIIAEKVYELATEGIHSLQVTKVEDLGVVEGTHGAKEKLRIHILVTDQKSKDGEPVNVFITASKSIGEKSTLGKFLRSLGLNTQGQVDLDELIGFKFQAVIEHNKGTNGKTYANIGSVIKSRKTLVPATTEEV
jgi:hypothetical protein